MSIDTPTMSEQTGLADGAAPAIVKGLPSHGFGPLRWPWAA
jgi:hypothetical protein